MANQFITWEWLTADGLGAVQKRADGRKRAREDAAIMRDYHAHAPKVGNPIHVKLSSLPSWAVKDGKLVLLNPVEDMGEL